MCTTLIRGLWSICIQGVEYIVNLIPYSASVLARYSASPALLVFWWEYNLDCLKRKRKYWTKGLNKQSYLSTPSKYHDAVRPK